MKTNSPQFRSQPGAGNVSAPGCSVPRPVQPKAVPGGFMLSRTGTRKYRAILLFCLALSLASAPGAAMAAPDETPQESAHRTPVKTADLPPVFRQRASGVVAAALDGDTLKLKDGRIIRLACIDAPDLETSLTRSTKVTDSRDFRGRDFHAEGAAEQKKKDEPSARAGKGRAKPERYAQYYAEISRRFLQQTAAGKKVTLRAEKQEKDKQGRILCDLELGDGTTLSSRMVRSGCAYVIYDPDFPKAYQQNLLEQQTDAIHARRGFWSLILSGSAAGRTFTGDSATRLFYSSTDVRGLRLKPRMRVYFGNLLDAFSSGYAPARSTDFWPVNLRVSEGKKKDRKR